MGAGRVKIFFSAVLPSALTGLIAWTLVAIVLSWLTDKLISRLSDWQPSVRYRHSAVELQTVSLQPNDICLTDVSYSYGVHHMNIILKAGKIYVLSAPSGQGKLHYCNSSTEL